ncbi:MAG: cellulase family glycosylhydrolase [Spirochaetales bacterium]|nr:cellulase family glycosylhydrolase [Spirochaetales bacterium]
MDLLQVKGKNIIDKKGNPVFLRGVCVGGWMNMENFINGYPGAERGLRYAFKQVMGKKKAEFFFDTWLDHFFNEEDVKFLKSIGVTCIRIPVNYRHLEDDTHPFQYLSKGFTRLSKAVEWGNKHGIYTIIDLHSVQGFQNPDWHCDNSTRHTFFWEQKNFQDRFVALWEEIARRFKGKAGVAGYNIMNEPVNNAPFGKYGNAYATNWKSLNAVYQRTVEAIRAVDPEHIIFLEGDHFSQHFSGLKAPFAPNLVYSSHNYNKGGFGPGPYPGIIRDEEWDKEKQAEVFNKHDGTKFTQKHSVPLWIGEFGSVYNGLKEEIPFRLKALDDQIAVFNENAAHWTSWTYKDVGVMGVVYTDPDSGFMKLIAQQLKTKIDLSTDFWMWWLPKGNIRNQLDNLHNRMVETIDDPAINKTASQSFFAQEALSGYVSNLMQPGFATLFKDLTEKKIDAMLSAFNLNNCIKRSELADILARHLAD